MQDMCIGLHLMQDMWIRIHLMLDMYFRIRLMQDMYRTDMYTSGHTPHAGHVLGGTNLTCAHIAGHMPHAGHMDQDMPLTRRA